MPGPFCKGSGRRKGIPPERTSPSFTVATRHEGRLPLTHVDVYRVDSVTEALEVGLDEMFVGDGVCVVEWAEKVTELLTTDCVRVTFTISDEDERAIAVSAPDQPRFRGFLSRSQRFQPGG
jgi:tRNA threonylcarbamoyladenosine biosynthesis protein TsaE